MMKMWRCLPSNIKVKIDYPVLHVHRMKSLIELLNPNKATGPDGVSNKMLKAVTKEVAVPLSIFFNRSFREGKFEDIY